MNRPVIEIDRRPGISSWENFRAPLRILWDLKLHPEPRDPRIEHYCTREIIPKRRAARQAW